MEFNCILANQKLVELARKVDLVNPKQKEAPTAAGSNVFGFSLLADQEICVISDRASKYQNYKVFVDEYLYHAYFIRCTNELVVVLFVNPRMRFKSCIQIS